MAGENDLSTKTFRRKKTFYEALPDLKLVAVSSWLRDKAENSALTAGRHIEVIPNAFPLEDFYISPKGSIEGIPDDKKIILMGAARLDDPVKGLPYAVEILNKLEVRDTIAVFFGELRNRDALGCTPVAFDSGGQRDIIDEGKTGYLVRPYDTESFAEVLTKALANPFDPHILRDSVEKRFSATAVAGRYLQIIR